MANSSSSAKKVARAARAGGSTRSVERRSLGFPLAVALIVMLGVPLVAYARTQRSASADALPRIGQDHWHSAYGIYVCGEWEPFQTDQNNDQFGIHTHDDGLIHIHPRSGLAAGDKATLGVFLDEIGVTLTDSEIELPTGEARKVGDKCGDKDGVLRVLRWDANNLDAEPAIFDSDFGDIKFESDREAYTIAFVPADEVADVPPPETVAGIDNVTDVEEFNPDSTTADDQGGAGEVDTTTTVEGSTATTEPPGADSGAGGTGDGGATSTTGP